MKPLFEKYCANYKGLSYPVWQGIGIGFLESTLVGICYFLSLYFVKELHLSITNAGFILSSYGLGTILGGIIAGKLSDRFSSRLVTIASLLIQSLGYFLLIKIHTLPLLMATLFILGIGSYGFITSNYVWTLGNCKKDERLKAINMLDIVSNLGLALAGILIGFLSTQHFTYIFLISSCALCLIALYLIFFSQKKQMIEDLPLSSKSNSSSTINLSVLYYALGCLFFVGLIISQTSSTYPIFLQNSFPEMGTMSFSILFILNALLIVLFQAPLVNSLANVNKIMLIGLGAFLLGLGMVLLNVSFFAIAVLSCIILTVGEILFFSIAQLICYEKSPEKKKGSGLGSYRMIYAASRVTGPAVGSLIYQQVSGQGLWVVCFLLGIVCFIPSLYFRKFD